MKQLDNLSTEQILKLLPEPLIKLYALNCAKYAITFVKNPDKRITNCIEVTERYLNGDATLEEIKSAASYAAAAAPSAAAASYDASRKTSEQYLKQMLYIMIDENLTKVEKAILL